MFTAIAIGLLVGLLLGILLILAYPAGMKRGA